METLLHKNTEHLQKAWEGIQQAKPGIRIREAARALEVSEAELLATTIGDDCIRLAGSWQDLLKRFKALGHVMSLTRNDACILEHKGTFQKVNVFGKDDHAMATVIGPIETRVFFKNWHVAFAVSQEKRGRLLQTIQVFDKAGDAITKIYLQEKSDEAAFHQLINDFRSKDQSPEQEVAHYDQEDFLESIDQESFLREWDALKDTHDFFPMLRKYQVNRFHALKLAEDRFTYQIETSAVEQILRIASKTKLPIMIFAGNKGNLQIHQGKVRTIRLLERGHGGVEQWLNVLDPAFNMHLRMDLVNTTWVVKKPTEDGMVTSVELFDEDKNLIAQFFGLRKPGKPQQEEWNMLVSSLERLK
jgi:putative hemin transport protein